MEAKPEQRYRQDHVQEEAEKGEDAMERGGGLSLHPAGSTMFGQRRDEEAGGRRGEIWEVDFFSQDSGARRQDGDGRSVPGGGRDDVNVRELSPRSSLTYVAVRLLLLAEVTQLVALCTL
jgi:hypothetical protein